MSMQHIFSRNLGSRLARGALLLPLALLVLAGSGCDRTRPYPGLAADVDAPAPAPKVSTTPATPAPPSGGGPVQTPAGWSFAFEAPDASSVHLAGTFNDWSTSADPMQKQDDGTWTLVKALPPGSHTYKFVINGTDWKEDPSNPETTDDGYGGKNSVLNIVTAITPPENPPMPRQELPQGILPLGPVNTPQGTRFTFQASARSVHLAGDFNSWSTTADPMKENPGGVWTLVKKLPSGSHAYKFVVDGSTWKEDPNAPEDVDDGFGGKNSVVVVP